MRAVRDPIDPKLSLWHFLAYSLRFEREKRGLSLAQWGDLIGCARSHVSNIEACRRKLDEGQARIIDEKYDTGGRYELMLWHARTGHVPDWLKSVTSYEAVAQVIRIYHGQVIPPPFQTEAYARALLKASVVKEVEATLSARMERQDVILSRAEPPFVWAVLDETVLESLIGGAEVMRAQLEHLLELMNRPHISIRIIPRSTGAHMGLDGPFRIISLQAHDVAYAGAYRGGRLIEMPGEVAEFRLDFEQIGHRAISTDASRTLTERKLETIT